MKILFLSLLFVLGTVFSPDFLEARTSARGAFSGGIEAFHKGELSEAMIRWNQTIWYAIDEKQQKGWPMTSNDYQLGSLAYLYRGLTYLKRNKNSDAFADFVRAERYSVDFPDIQVQIAAQYYKLDLFDETRRLCQSILENDPGNATAHYYLGYAEMEGGNQGAALEHAKKAKDLGYPYAKFLIQKIEDPESKAQMENLQENLPENFLEVAIHKFQDGSYDQAIEICRKILNGNRNNGLAHYYLGFSYFKTGQKEKALEHAEKAQELGVSYAGLLIEKLKE